MTYKCRAISLCNEWHSSTVVSDLIFFIFLLLLYFLLLDYCLWEKITSVDQFSRWENGFYILWHTFMSSVLCKTGIDLKGNGHMYLFNENHILQDGWQKMTHKNNKNKKYIFRLKIVFQILFALFSVKRE